METKRVIILINVVGFSDGRKVAEYIENGDYNSVEEIIEAIKKEGSPDGLFLYKILELTDFMDECNNQEIELENWWISYVNLPKEAPLIF